MRIALIVKPGHEDSGVGRYTDRLCASLQALGHEVLIVYPVVPLPGWMVRVVRLLLGWDLQAFLENYPIWTHYPKADIYHLTSQNLATLMFFHRPPGKTIITVHDLIPWLVRKDPSLRIYEHEPFEWFDRLALARLRKADGLLAVSTFTRSSLLELGVTPEKIMVVPEGVR